MSVLVAYASEHGSTREVAELIGRVLTDRGLRVRVRSVGSADGPDGPDRYDAFVIGSAVHDQRWLPPAVDFVRRHAATLASRPVWLFSVGMPGALRWPLSRFATAEEPRLPTQFQDVIRPVAHRLFSGVIAAGHLPWTGRLAFRAIGGRYGDYRNRLEIEAWAGRIAADLTAGPEADQR